ncbi:MAG: 2-amino-4-hydroxy-6-hydroxymethyldihydropteridine diphosphokinase [Bacteroidota bacterium]|nr:2-amino-4-hydroxy-6-hydroxymethyldihydropteridine diphosphokinase [Bacteroidota bacterium]
MIKNKLIYLSLGSNLGNRLKNLKRALELLQLRIGVIKKTSSIYETKSVGFVGQDFLNLCVSIETNFSPKKLLEELLGIEILMGRIKTNIRNLESRKIDLDILFYGNEIIVTEELKIPHPRLENRNFVLYPMQEIAPDLIHPGLKIKINFLLKNSSDNYIPLKLKIKAS